MPWQKQSLPTDAAAADKTVWVVAGDAAGLVHVWAGTGAGQHTWQHHSCHHQVTSHLHSCCTLCPYTYLTPTVLGACNSF